MLIRALLAFLALPGIFAFVLPLFLVRHNIESCNYPGFIPLMAGTALLLWCVRDFYTAGRGTLAPWSPPQNLVTTGLYRISRNPMYIAVALILSGWTLAYWSITLLIYTVIVTVAFHLRVVYGEEPWLACRHGEQWLLYKKRVPRWLLK